jgi:hypothetical protein
MQPYGYDDERIVRDAITSLDETAARDVLRELLNVAAPHVSNLVVQSVWMALIAFEEQMEERDGSRQATTHDPDRATGGSGADAQEDDATATDPRASAGTGAGEGLSLVPDAITPVVGWRAWDVDDVVYPSEVRSLHSRFEWKPGTPAHAKCDVPKRRHAPKSCRCPLEAAPAANCTCGIYAARSLDTLPDDYITDRNGLVLGRVALWGRTIVHDDGWRGELAYPQAFFLRPDQEHLRTALVPFGVPILSAADLPPHRKPEAEPESERALDVEVICRACGTMTLGYTKARKFCDECLAINREITAVRSAAKGARSRGLDVGRFDEAIAQLESQRPRPAP